MHVSNTSMFSRNNSTDRCFGQTTETSHLYSSQLTRTRWQRRRWPGTWIAMRNQCVLCMHRRGFGAVFDQNVPHLPFSLLLCMLSFSDHLSSLLALTTFLPDTSHRERERVPGRHPFLVTVSNQSVCTRIHKKRAVQRFPPFPSPQDGAQKAGEKQQVPLRRLSRSSSLLLNPKPSRERERAIDTSSSSSSSAMDAFSGVLVVDGDALRRAAAAILLCAALLAALLQQITYLRKKGPLPGPYLVVPFLGSAVPMILDPTRFWSRQADRAKSSSTGLAADFLVGRFIVFVRSTDLSHKVFANVRPDAFHLIGHPFGRKLFGEHNLIYMFGDPHKDLRRRIAPNFTPRALAAYLPLQQRVILRHLRSWLADGEPRPIPLRLRCRDMNLETSQTVFAGPYLTPAARERFNRDYNLFNVGLMAIPFDFPGFAFRRARLAVDRLVRTLSGCVSHSKDRVRSGAEPSCLVDFWMQELLREEDPSSSTPSDVEIGGHLFDFLFAAQDASTSSLLWAVSLLDAHPDVLSRVRAEVGRLWDPDSGEPVTAEQLSGMKYTEAVAREVVRFRPPATMVPHVAGEDFALTEWYTVPKGAIVFPSAFESSFQGFPDAERFDPDRFGMERQEDKLYRRNYLAFGAGPHQCVGQRYAINHLVLFIALFVSLVDFERHRTDGCDEIAYVPTIVPKDDCQVYLRRRRAAAF